jgi:hypothetical protein
MADAMPNIVLGRARKELELEELKMNKRRQAYRLLELDDEKVRIATNMAATDKAIAECEEVLRNADAAQAKAAATNN